MYGRQFGTPKDPSRVRGGRLAKERGSIAETIFDYSANYYVANRELAIYPTYPQFIKLGTIQAEDENGILSEHDYGFFREKATADRVGSVKDLGGQCVWIEIKSIDAANIKKVPSTRHQYDQMNEAAQDGKALGFYMVFWLESKSRAAEWRLYPLDSPGLELIDDHKSIRFHREHGVLVPGFDALNDSPDWLPVVKDLARPR